MKHAFLPILVCISFFSCTAPANNSKDSENMAIIKKYMDAVENNKPAVMDSLLAEDYMGYGPSVADSVNKKDALANWDYNASSLYESIKYTRHQNIAVTVKEGEQAPAGDWVTSWAYLTIKYKDGRGPVNVWVNVVYKIENGKIARSRTFYNEADVLHQLNYTIEPPQATP